MCPQVHWCLMMYLSSYFRGEYFRQEFRHLGAVRSLIPSHVNIMAMTATATTATRNEIATILSLDNPVVVAASPDKSNISYQVRRKTTLEEVFMPLLMKLKSFRCKLPRVIIFCRKCQECVKLYNFFFYSMREEFTEPVAAPNLPIFRLVDMYTGATRKSVQDSIITSFRNSDSPLRIVICTIAFGMGIDCTDVCQVIHWGPSSDVESYVQECGRAGRNGCRANALLLWSEVDVKSHVCKEMEHFCHNKETCRRALLMSYFDCPFENICGCICCDVCALRCKCQNCNPDFFPL